MEDNQILFVGSCVVGSKDIGAAEAKLKVADINSIQSVAAAERDRIANEQDRQSEVRERGPNQRRFGEILENSRMKKLAISILVKRSKKRLKKPQKASNRQHTKIIALQ